MFNFDDKLYIYIIYDFLAQILSRFWLFEDYGEVIQDMIQQIFLIGRFCGGGCNLLDSGLLMKYSIILIMFDL